MYAIGAVVAGALLNSMRGQPVVHMDTSQNRHQDEQFEKALADHTDMFTIQLNPQLTPAERAHFVALERRWVSQQAQEHLQSNELIKSRQMQAGALRSPYA